jgi:hypothetical protein
LQGNEKGAPRGAPFAFVVSRRRLRVERGHFGFGGRPKAVFRAPRLDRELLGRKDRT